MHSYGRLIPVNFLVTKPEQIEGPDGVGRVNCTASRGEASFQNSLIEAVTEVENENLYQIRSGSTATLIVDNIRRNFMNRQIFCNSLNHRFFLHFSDRSECTTFTTLQNLTIQSTCTGARHACIISACAQIYPYNTTCTYIQWKYHMFMYGCTC